MDSEEAQRKIEERRKEYEERNPPLEQAGGEVGDWLAEYRRRIEAGELGTDQMSIPYYTPKKDERKDLSSWIPERALADLRRLQRGELEQNDLWKAFTRSGAWSPGLPALLYGPTDTGKSTCAAYAVEQTFKTGQWSAWLDVTMLPVYLDRRSSQAIDEAFRAPLLVLDQLHDAKWIGRKGVAYLRAIVITRFEKTRPTVAAATCNLADLKEWIGEDLVRRWPPALRFKGEAS